ncbi:complement factor H-like [Pyxicephalus adspersus]|uniref:complement factor H-like n=1 Tax=Pyxicephalus adspersus TaxID=30357 RepID=UPI003B5953F5
MRGAAVIWGFLCVIGGSGADVIWGDDEVSVPYGATLSFTCLYDSGYAWHVKYWCKGSYWKSCKNVVSTNGDNSDYRYSISDNRSGHLTITGKRMRPEDSDTYFCGVERTFTDYMHAVRVTVLPAQCEKPTIGNVQSLSNNKEFYNKGESVTVQCKSGYYPSSYRMRCDNPRTSQEWTPPTVTCTAQCRRPIIENVESLTNDKEYYNNGKSVTIRCKSGYYPSSDTMICHNPRTSQEWTPPTITCIAQCRRPIIGNVGKITEDKEYYNKGESVTVQCKSGYYPSSDTMTCEGPRTAHEWTPPIVTCKAQCAKPTIGNVQRLIEDKEYYNKGELVTVQCKSGYHPSADTMTCDNPRTSQEWTLPNVTCTGKCGWKTMIWGQNISMYPEKEYYGQNEEVTLTCPAGYRPNYSKIQCINVNGTNTWNVTEVFCIQSPTVYPDTLNHSSWRSMAASGCVGVIPPMAIKLIAILIILTIRVTDFIKRRSSSLEESRSPQKPNTTQAARYGKSQHSPWMSLISPHGCLSSVTIWSLYLFHSQPCKSIHTPHGKGSSRGT